jgi:hypothetical protein
VQQRALVVVLLTLAAVAVADDPPKPVSAKEPELRLELIRRAQDDQAARSAMDDGDRQQR